MKVAVSNILDTSNSIASSLDANSMHPSRGQKLDDTPMPPAARSSDLSPTAKLMISGGIAGAVAKTVTAPLARLTILYQVQPSLHSQVGSINLPKAITHIVQREGVFALWKGNAATILHRLPYSSINFYTYEACTQHLEQFLPRSAGHGVHSQDIFRRLASGAVAGAVAGTAAYPLDLIRTRLAAHTCTTQLSIHSLFSSIIKEEGVLGLYRGLGATLVQLIPSLAINYCAYESLKSVWMSKQAPNSPPSMGGSLACGSLAGFISSSLTFPLDTIRRCMQLQGRKSPSGGTYWGLVGELYASRGLLGFYRGIIPEYYKVIPGVAITFCTYEMMKQVLRVNLNKR